MNTFEDLVVDIRKARSDGEQILKNQGIENVDLGQQNVMLQFWQIEAVVYELERLRELVAVLTLEASTPLPYPRIEHGEQIVSAEEVKKVVPFNKNLKKDQE